MRSSSRSSFFSGSGSHSARTKFDFASATNCLCKIEPVVDNLGNLKPNIHLILGMHSAVPLLLPENHPTRIKDGSLKTLFFYGGESRLSCCPNCSRAASSAFGS